MEESVCAPCVSLSFRGRDKMISILALKIKGAKIKDCKYLRENLY